MKSASGGETSQISAGYHQMKYMLNVIQRKLKQNFCNYIAITIQVRCGQ